MYVVYVRTHSHEIAWLKIYGMFGLILEKLAGPGMVLRRPIFGRLRL